MATLESAVADPAVSTRARALDVLRGLGEEALPLLTRVAAGGGRIGMLAADEIERRAEAAPRPNGYEKLSVAALLEALRAPPNDRAIEPIVNALAKKGPAAAPAVPALNAMLRRGSCTPAVIEALGRIGPAAAVAVPALVGALKQPEEYAARGAARALCRIGRGSAGATRDLVAALSHGDLRVRAMVAVALGKIGPAASEAMPALVQRLRTDPYGQVRVAASLAISRVRGEPVARPDTAPATAPQRLPQKRALLVFVSGALVAAVVTVFLFRRRRVRPRRSRD